MSCEKVTLLSTKLSATTPSSADSLEETITQRGEGLKPAMKNRHADITVAQDNKLAAVEPPCINIYKLVEMRYKYRPIIPQDDKGDALYADVPEEVCEAMKEEKSKGQVFKKELNKKKKKAMKREMEKATELEDKDMMLV